MQRGWHWRLRFILVKRKRYARKAIDNNIL